MDKFHRIYQDSFNSKLYTQFLKYYDKNKNLGLKDFDSLKNNIIYFSYNPFEFFNKLKYESIDFLFSNAVLEHIFYLDLAIKE